MSSRPIDLHYPVQSHASSADLTARRPHLRLHSPTIPLCSASCFALLPGRPFARSATCIRFGCNRDSHGYAALQRRCFVIVGNLKFTHSLKGLFRSGPIVLIFPFIKRYPATLRFCTRFHADIERLHHRERELISYRSLYRPAYPSVYFSPAFSNDFMYET